MAKAKKRGAGWGIQFRRGLVSEMRTFPTAAQANAWHAKMLVDYTAGKLGKVANVPTITLFERYAREISPRKKGERWEIVRLKLLGRDPLAQVPLPELDQPHIAQWRDRRRLSVSDASVNREWTLLSGVFTVAINEWRALERHPMKGVRRPAKTAPRDRMPSHDEIERLRYVCGDHGQDVKSRVFLAFLFAIETGMRCSEITGLERISGCVAFLADTKNGTSRQVALSPAAVKIWTNHGPFDLKSWQVDAYFRRACKQAAIIDLHFHDSRHAAITQLAEKLEILELARTVGIKNLRELMTYYNKPISEIAKKLDRKSVV